MHYLSLSAKYGEYISNTFHNVTMDVLSNCAYENVNNDNETLFLVCYVIYAA